MLGSELLSVRLGGIHALVRIAEEHRSEYHIQIMELLCAFVRHPPKGQPDDARELRERKTSAKPVKWGLL